ncbi:MAG TPA: NACHT domain-containing protein [Coleofasciculaceae cyanobacterium]
MVDWLILWGVTQVLGFAFKDVLVKLATAALEDYVKDFFKGSIKNLVDLAKEKPLKVALGQALKEFLGLVQQELEDAEVDATELEQYVDSLDNFVRDSAILENLGKPFQIALGNISQADNQSLDTATLAHTWNNLNLKALPKNFDWERVGKRYKIKADSILRESQELRELLNAENLGRMRKALEEIDPISPDFEFSRYRGGLMTAYGKLKLDTLDTSGCNYSLQLWSIFVPQNVREESNSQYTCSVLAILNEKETYKYTVILGNPGSGKSSLAQYKGLTWARTQPSALPLLELPLLIELRNYIENCQKKLCKNFLEYFHQGTGIPSGNLNQKELHEWLKNRQTLVMFDGLDEVLDAQERENVVIDIINFTKTYPKVRVLVTSRVIGYEQQRQRLRDANFRDFMLQDLDREQIHNFINQWHQLAFDDKNEGERRRERLQRSIDSSRAFSELAGNPLLLTMMAILNRHEELPRDRPTLYKEASEVLLQRWDAAKNLEEDKKIDSKINHIEYLEKQEMLRAVAHYIQTSDGGLSGNLSIQRSKLCEILAKCLEIIGFAEPKIVAISLMKQLTSRSFILCFKGGESYGFVHRTFLEYFCAWYFVDHFETKQTKSIQDLQDEVFGKHWRNPSWHEVLSLIVGMVDERFAGELIDYLIQQDGSSDGFMNLFLAEQCVSNVRNPRLIKPMTTKLLNQLKQLAEGQVQVMDTARNEAIEAIRRIEGV